MSRWDTYPTNGGGGNGQNPTYFPQNAPPPLSGSSIVGPAPPDVSLTGASSSEAYQHGTIGDFIRSDIEGAQSGFIRCMYTAKNTANNTVTVLCEKAAGCCTHGCCPKDQFWMAGVFVLLAFVLLVFVVGAVIMIVCYQRSKNKTRREEKEAAQAAAVAAAQGGPYDYGAYGSQVGMYPQGYGNYGGGGYASEAHRY